MPTKLLCPNGHQHAKLVGSYVLSVEKATITLNGVPTELPLSGITRKFYKCRRCGSEFTVDVKQKHLDSESR